MGVLEHVADGGLPLQVVQGEAGGGGELRHVHHLEEEEEEEQREGRRRGGVHLKYNN